jgi:hypothetical protein
MELAMSPWLTSIISIKKFVDAAVDKSEGYAEALENFREKGKCKR